MDAILESLQFYRKHYAAICVGQFVLSRTCSFLTYRTQFDLPHEPVVEMIHCMIDVFLDRDLSPILEVVFDTPLS